METDTTVGLGGFYAILAPYLLTALGVAITAIVGWGCTLVQRKFNISVDQSNRDALQTALMNAAGKIVQHLGSKAAAMQLNVGSALIADGARYVEKAAPDALKHFGITPESLAEKVAAKIPQLPPTSTPVPARAAAKK